MKKSFLALNEFEIKNFEANKIQGCLYFTEQNTEKVGKTIDHLDITHCETVEEQKTQECDSSSCYDGWDGINGQLRLNTHEVLSGFEAHGVKLGAKTRRG